MMPNGMIAVTKEEFFARLKADPRDIMPKLHARDFTTWEVVSTRALWGWSTPGWANPGAAKVYAVRAPFPHG